MRVGLFIPCTMDRLYPRAAMASLELLEKLGVTVEYPQDQTCCGQPMANSGLKDAAAPVVAHFAKVFADYDYVVCPSGSCTSMIRNHTHGMPGETAALRKVRGTTFEFCEFLHDVLKVGKLDAACPRRVGIHRSCHGHRELRLAPSSERTQVKFRGKPEQLLSLVRDITITELDRTDECCGFGGAFCVGEATLSVRMGEDRVADHARHGAEIITSVDTSCLMHLEGVLRAKNSPVRVAHIAEILNGDLA